MPFLETPHKRKSAVLTSFILILILIGMFTLGMQYLDPPKEYGLAINFGTTTGSGDPVVNSKTSDKKEEVKDAPKKDAKEKVITQKTKDAPVIDQKKKEEVKKVIKPVPTKAAQDALNKLLNGDLKKGDTTGQGDDTNTGVKGAKKGDPKATKYYGNSGNDGDSNYNLSGRNALSKPIEKPDCNEEGTVVVSIEVDRTGKVIKATAGVKGTTNTAPCLLKPAKEAALKTTWNPDKNAPSVQVGTIIYKFSLSE